MRFELRMPDVATNDSPVRIIRWIAAVGQRVRRGEPLVEVETDKANVEVESVRDGVLVEVMIEAGNTASTGDVIAAIETVEAKG
jgi:pyruvate/2-oxoglutarate dehydrogenase complex dihydrolipoamide acyltransferase (E2) component